MIRSHHWTDIPVAGNDRVRVFENWCNHRTPAGLWIPSSTTVEDTTDTPPDWSGVYEFRHRKLNSILQTFIGDETDVGNRAMWGVRLSHQPGCWLNIKAIGIDNPVQPTRSGNKLTYSDLWTETDLELELTRHSVRKILRLKNPGHQTAYRFALRYPNGWSHEILDNCLYIKNDVGEVVFRTQPLWAFDSTPVNRKSIRLSMVSAPSITVGAKTFPTIRIVFNQTDLASAVYPIEADPSVTISGTTDIEDNFLYKSTPPGASSANVNYGGSTQLQMGCFADTYGSNESHVLFRINKAQIPAGTITAFSVTIKNNATTGFTVSHSIYSINSTSYDWVEGTANGTNQVGSSCMNQKKYSTTNWVAVGGFGGSDYDADASPPAMSITSGQAVGTSFTANLKTSWATDWRDNTKPNGGIVILCNGAVNATDTFYSTEAASNQPTFSITYTVGAAPAANKAFFTGGW